MADDLSSFTGEEGAGQSVPEPNEDRAVALAAEMAGGGTQGEPLGIFILFRLGA